MEKLIRYIEDHRTSLFDEEPSSGHFERFLQRQKARNKARRVNLSLIATAAAMACLVVTGSLSILLNNPASFNLGKFTASHTNASSELNEVNFYYANELAAKYRLVNQLALGSAPEVEKEIREMLAEFNQSKAMLEQDLSDSPSREHLLTALTQNYQLRIEMLDQVYSKLTSLKMKPE